MLKNKLKPGYLLLLVMILAGFGLESWNISQQPVEEWDEARRGINALGMLSSGDYLNYYFLDEVDTFNSKPPLTVWLIALNFKIFGVTNFALRFHSILAIYLFLLLFARIIILYRNTLFAALVIGILISVQGIIGFHVGRTGDTDSLLLLFLTAFIYFFLKYWDFNERRALYVAAIFFGLAFYTKSVAAFIPVPGVIAYMLITRSKKFFNKEIIISLSIAILIILSWFFLAAKGAVNDRSHLTLWERIFSVDLYRRFTDRDFEAGYDPFYIIHVLDMNFNIWNYIMYIGGIVGLYRVFRNKIIDKVLNDRLVLFSLLITGSYTIILTISMNKHQWYLAPAYPFFAVLTTEFIFHLRNKWIYMVSIILVLALFIIRFKEYNQNNNYVHDFFASNRGKIESSGCLFVDHSVPQDLIFEFVRWNYRNAGFYQDLHCPEGSCIYFGKALPSRDLIVAGKLEGYSLLYRE